MNCDQAIRNYLKEVDIDQGFLEDGVLAAICEIKMLRAKCIFLEVENDRVHKVLQGRLFKIAENALNRIIPEGGEIPKVSL